ncbi:MAG: EamA family transporter [Phycisphaerae bacterium]|nr:EamA family transporter [Phycisphaerae bacterium]
MKTWLIFALLAMVCWGSYIVVAKVATVDKYCGLGPKWSAILMLIGIIIVVGIYGIFSKDPKPTITAPSAAAGVSQGILWAMGMVFSLFAFKAGADVSCAVPIFNCNTLVAVLLGIMILREVPDLAGAMRIVIGSLLIVSGGVLVAR